MIHLHVQEGVIPNARAFSSARRDLARSALPRRRLPTLTLTSVRTTFGMRTCVPHHFAANEGLQRPYVADLFRRDRKKILAQQDHVRQLPNTDGSLLVLLKFRVCRPHRISRERLLKS